MATRPETIECEVCGIEVKVAPKGRVPRFCAEHTAADLPEPDDIPTTGAPEPEPEPESDDDWPRQVAPCVWLGPSGERWTDMGDAERGMAEIRGKR